MNEELWWKKWPEVLDREKAAFNAAQIAWKINEQALSQSVMRFDLKLPPERGAHELFVSLAIPDRFFRKEHTYNPH